jgi:hypothetical protein
VEPCARGHIVTIGGRVDGGSERQAHGTTAHHRSRVVADHTRTGRAPR